MNELWRGCANAWECDELGHLNVRFYMAKVWEALGNLANSIGLDSPAASKIASTISLRDLTVAYLGEIRPGAPLFIEGGVVDIEVDHASLCLIVRQSASGRIAAVFRVRVENDQTARKAAAKWSNASLEKLHALRIDTSNIASPRGLTSSAPVSGTTTRDADLLRLQLIGIGRINPEDCDVSGTMMPEHLFGKISNSVANFSEAFPEQIRSHREGRSDVGGALLEARIVVRRLPHVGEGFVIRSGVKAADRNVRTIIHWVFDDDGQLLWSMQGVAAILDLATRKIQKADDRILADLKAAIRPGLKL